MNIKLKDFLRYVYHGQYIVVKANHKWIFEGYPCNCNCKLDLEVINVNVDGDNLMIWCLGRC